jgi:hypothetical protein
LQQKQKAGFGGGWVTIHPGAVEVSNDGEKWLKDNLNIDLDEEFDKAAIKKSRTTRV